MAEAEGSVNLKAGKQNSSNQNNKKKRKAQTEKKKAHESVNLTGEGNTE